MGGGETNGRTWTVLARCRAPVEARLLWEALLAKTEHPERFNPAVARAEVLDHDASVVVRRTYPSQGQPYIEWLEHERRATRVVLRRRGSSWHRAQALVEGPDGPHLVYEVDDPEAAAADGGIDACYAEGVLAQILAAARGA